MARFSMHFGYLSPLPLPVKRSPLSLPAIKDSAFGIRFVSTERGGRHGSHSHNRGSSLWLDVCKVDWEL